MAQITSMRHTEAVCMRKLRPPRRGAEGVRMTAGEKCGAQHGQYWAGYFRWGSPAVAGLPPVRCWRGLAFLRGTCGAVVSLFPAVRRLPRRDAPRFFVRAAGGGTALAWRCFPLRRLRRRRFSFPRRAAPAAPRFLLYSFPGGALRRVCRAEITRPRYEGEGGSDAYRSASELFAKPRIPDDREPRVRPLPPQHEVRAARKRGTQVFVLG